MTVRQTRTLLLTAALLAILVGLLLGVRACSARQAEEEASAAQAEKSARAVPTKAADFVSIAYDNSTTNLAFQKDDEGTWIWADDPAFPLDGTYMDTLSTILTSLDPMQTITDGDTLEAYGLETPSATVTATAADGSVTTLLLGKALSDGSYYLKTDDADTVYVVASTLHERLTMGVYEMARLETFPALTNETLRSLTIQGPKTVTFAVQDGVWTQDGTDVSQQSAVQALSTELSALAFAACRDFNPSEKAVEICGLTKPAIVVTAEYETEAGKTATLVLNIGANTPEADGRFARLGEGTTIYSLKSESIATIVDLARNGLSA